MVLPKGSPGLFNSRDRLAAVFFRPGIFKKKTETEQYALD